MGTTTVRASFSRELSSVRRRKAIGATLKARRERRHWTLAHVAEKASFSLGKLWRIENGEARVRLEDLEILGSILHVPVAKLIALDAPEKLAAAQKKQPKPPKAPAKKKTAPPKKRKAATKKARKAPAKRRAAKRSGFGPPAEPPPVMPRAEMPAPSFSAHFEKGDEPEIVEAVEQPEPRVEVEDDYVDGFEKPDTVPDHAAPDVDEALPPEDAVEPPPANADDVDARAAS
jgi:transcriptional regulator with XRE-family HTH domain